MFLVSVSTVQQILITDLFLPSYQPIFLSACMIVSIRRDSTRRFSTARGVFMNQFPPSLRVSHSGRIKFFAKIRGDIHSWGAPQMSSILVANGKNLGNSSTLLLIMRIHPTPNKVLFGESGFWIWIQVVNAQKCKLFLLFICLYELWSYRDPPKRASRTK